MQTWFSKGYEDIALKLACWDKSIRVQKKKKKLMREAEETALKQLPSQPLKKRNKGAQAAYRSWKGQTTAFLNLGLDL